MRNFLNLIAIALTTLDVKELKILCSFQKFSSFQSKDEAKNDFAYCNLKHCLFTAGFNT